MSRRRLTASELRALDVLAGAHPAGARFAAVTTSRGFTDSAGVDHEGPHVYGPVADDLIDLGLAHAIPFDGCVGDVWLTDAGVELAGELHLPRRLA